MGIARTRRSFASAQRNPARTVRRRKSPQILSTEAVEPAGEICPSPAHVLGERVSGGGPLDTTPQWRRD
ncbi:hypothetical protein CIB93_09735 [Streptomyces sp. WZ.A104]|uniref:hypothetical protein n=1 Tax=Streptomyces sp. WZ.A104 TaxID=2023771 RepID=UPI000BBCDA65|nr:hypothetical protein [Streptomyces sp. WZ.A104]PCG86240.1 hypothetical protein CIB93_09735 [Streptomyces sp. WZ.A104]